MSRDFAEMLEAATPTAEVMEVDTSFLDAYRRGGSEELKRVQAQAAQSEPEVATPEPEAQLDEAGDVDPQPEVESLQPDPDMDAEEDRLDLEPDSERASGSNQRGGNGGGQGGTAGALPGGPPAGPMADVVPAPGAQPDLEDAAAAEVTSHDVVATPDESEHVTPGSLQLTDHQDAVQSAASKGGSGSTAETATLPQSGFRLAGVQSQPHIKALPENIMNALREQLRAAAVRELGVSDSTAREFSQRLSQGTLVTAFLLAQLDLHLDADPATERAVELFRSRDPLLGSVVARLANIEAAERERDGLLRKLRDELGEVRQTSAVIEQAMAYSIADRTENFLRGSHNLHDAPITHKEAIYLRDKAREATRKQLKLERERDGRPIR
ncbi:MULTISPECIES: hypothetical protein [Streptomyces]|uniref:hypothetical protein n=1 Tax=Streptomyces TaxID=1883 RepID=UPI0004C0AC99|nr:MULTISPECIES: hypothetical protein [Streptomyces]MDX3280455.1 hypothetical protein [Streptomyces scabiei]MDX3846936.1 hypothetical protein [Streptomyces europaeiscabiei]